MSIEYLTTAELAERLKVSERTVRSWRMKGEGPRFIKVGKGSGAVRYPVEAINEWVRGIMQSHTL